MVPRLKHKEDGFTVVEVLIALTISTIVLALVSSIFIFVNQQFLRGESNLKFYNSVHIAQTKLYNDLRYGDDVVLTDTSIVIGFRNDEENIYTLTSGKLLLNNSELKSDGVDSLFLQNFTIDELKNIVEWELVQVQDDRKTILRSSLFLRKPNLWNSTNSMLSNTEG
ncbi:hypothetical protein A8B79_04300 [Balneola sp. EhC07]|uniref:prepilin-type N-terminal cleavage/methylation domain-containing protein n=1 Tax=Balneola sp. EhC07 TaxID=1849360 RepID=UPI0007F32680|nr:prepilin-type N-terminal cleavage/methylation domain-containing protein [Balneola sp. EhC07]OAN61654.1 hypothetical protein A8B79_04300 [Balneola sp. EhC07]